jgi:ElaA protein
MEITWQCSPFSALTVEQLYKILQARSQVFVVEQNCPYLDADGADPDSLHLIAWTADHQVAAYLRIVPPGLKYPEASLGRVLSSAIGRGTGIGKTLLIKGIEACKQSFPEHPIRIGAQQYLEKFYQSFGFVTVSDMYLEDDIPHVEMLRE